MNDVGRGSALQTIMDRSYDKRHTKHHKDKHKKRIHKKHRTPSDSRDLYVTSHSNKPLVEYSDVSSEALSAPEAGEIDSEASSIGRHIPEDLDRTRKTHSMRTFVGNKTISVTTTNRRVVDVYNLTRETTTGSSRKQRTIEYVPEPEFDTHSRYKKKKEKRKKDKKKRKKKSKHRSRSASLESVSPDDNVPQETAVRVISPQRYQQVPISEWEKASSPLRNGSCSPVSPTTPPLLRHEPSPRHRPVHREPSIHHDTIPFSPHRERSPPVRYVILF